MGHKHLLINKPIAWIPIALSLTVLIIFFISFVIFGIPHRSNDEGTEAHLFQLWAVLEVLMIGFFAYKWLPQRPNQAMLILAFQIIAVIAASSPVYFLNL